jgi:hypothetical protein
MKMRIVTAIARFTKDYHDSIPFDQLAELDVAWDSDSPHEVALNKPLFYFFAGDWISVTSVVSKPYQQALIKAATDIDEHLHFCCRQIELFHRVYFYARRFALHESQQQAEIRVVNWLRNYSTWRYIAESGLSEKLTPQKIDSDLAVVLEIARNEYATLIARNAGELRKASADSAMPSLLQMLSWLQRLLDVPTAAVGMKYREIMASLLISCAEIEDRIEKWTQAELAERNLSIETVKLPESKSNSTAKWAAIADTVWSTDPFMFDGDYEKLVGHPAWRKKIRKEIEKEADKILKKIMGEDGKEKPLDSTLWVSVKGIEAREIIRALVARNVFCWCALYPMSKDRAAVLLGHPEHPPRRGRRTREEIEAAKKSHEEKPKDTLAHFTDCLRHWGLRGLDEKQFAQGQDYLLWKDHEKRFARKRLPKR